MRRLALALTLVAALAGPALATPDEELIRAVYEGDLRGMQAQLRLGASFNAKDENGYTPLHWAAYRGDVRMAQYMLDRGATVDVPDAAGATPLMLAAWNGHAQTTRLLLDRGAARATRSADGHTAYDYAASKGHTLVQRMLGVPGAPALAYTPPTTYRPTPAPTPYTRWVATPRPRGPARPPVRPRMSPRAAFQPSPVVLATPTPNEETFIPSIDPDFMASDPPQGPPLSSPVVTPTPEVIRRQEISLVGGVHLSKISFPIAGVHYRLRLHDWFSARLGYEGGRHTSPIGGLNLDYGYSRLSASLLTNGWLYVGTGVTQVTLGTIYNGGYNPSRVAYDAIGGLRGSVNGLGGALEFRFGVDGPSTATLSATGAF